MSESDPFEFMRRYVAGWRDARPDLDIEALELVSWLGQTVREVETRVEHLAEAGGLKLGELVVLLALRREPDLSALPTQLSRALWVTSGGMTYRIDRLVERGLVRRGLNPDDRRSTRVELSHAGVELADRLQTQINALESRIVGGLETDERAMLSQLIRKMLSRLVEWPRDGAGG